jgi:RHS repeat-associated protein
LQPTQTQISDKNRYFTRALGNTTVMTYNTLSQKTAMIDPDMGAWKYEYDAAGNLITQTDALNNKLWFKYDPLNRLEEKRHINSSGNLLARYTYGSTAPNIGYRLRMDDPSGYTTWAYDNRGRVVTDTKVITGGGTFITTYGYDLMDRPIWMKYPGGNAGQLGEQVNFTYNAAGLLNSVIGASTYAQSMAYDAAGRVTQRVLGSNVLQQNYVYYPWTTFKGQGRLQQIKAGVPGNLTSLQDLNYTYDAVGNVLTILDNKAGGAQTQTFTYDALDRLQTAQASGGTGGTYALETYTYDAIGNIKSKPGVGVYTYTASAAGCVAGTPSIKPHAVSATTGGYSYAYDCNGNMTQRNEPGLSYTQQWDRENRLITVTGSASGSFVYDGDGNRVKATLNGVTTAYVGNYYEQTGVAIKKYYYAGGTRVALNDNGTLYWLLGDHLGSTSITANSSGGLFAELRYKPWGEERHTNGVTTPTRRQYTGQIKDAEIGLYFYNARYYSSAVGRFLSADTIVPSPSDPQQLNRYAYGLNNPVKYIDPSGHCAVEGDDDKCSPPPNKVPPVVQFTYDKMVAAAKSETAKFIRSLNAQCTACAYQGSPLWWPGMLQAYTSAIRNDGTARLLAQTRWASMVCENCDWDYKKPIQRMEKAGGRNEAYQRVGNSSYYFDTWTNIVYGYVGRSVGFSADELLDGAGVEQIGSDLRHGRPLNANLGDPWRNFDEPTDGPGITVGINLWEAYGLVVTPEQLLGAIASAPGLKRRSVNDK